MDNGHQLSKKIVLIFSLVALTSAAAFGTWWYIKVRPIDAIQKHVRSKLKDPASAQFENIQFDAKSDIGCGAVNGKNAMGGYVGFKSFIAWPDGNVMIQPDEPLPFGDLGERIHKTEELIEFLTLFKELCPDLPKQ